MALFPYAKRQHIMNTKSEHKINFVLQETRSPFYFFQNFISAIKMKNNSTFKLFAVFYANLS